MEEPSRQKGETNKQSPKEGGPSAAPSISLPKGGGAIRGIGEKFATNPVTGTASLSVPIYTSPGRSGFGPQLSLSYDSGSGNGPFGFGWSLSLPSITRKTDKGLPQYRDAEESDVYILSGAEDLVPVLQPDGSRFEDDTSAPGYTIHRYRPRIEGLFARIERWARQSDGDVHWRSISRDNILTLYGKDDNARIADPTDPSRIFTWLICETRDDKGNTILYEYAEENSKNVNLSYVNERNRTEDSRKSNRYIKRIKYGNKASRLIQPDLTKLDWHFQVVFDYEEGHFKHVSAAEDDPFYVEAWAKPAQPTTWPVRQDPFSTYRAGFEIRTYRLCRRVLMFHDFEPLGGSPCLVRSTDFAYEEGPVASFIRTVSHSGYVRQVDENGAFTDRYLKKSLPPVEFTYSKVPTDAELALLPVEKINASSLEHLPIGLDGARYQWVDLDGEGISGVLTEEQGAWYYKDNLGDGELGPMRMVAKTPALAVAGGNHQLLDLAADGQLDVVLFDSPTPGFYERTHDFTWETFRTFTNLPNVAWHAPNLKFVDLTGDGHADLIISEDEAFIWHRSLAEEGFAPAERVAQAIDEEKGPRLVFADSTQSIYLTDMSGDGLTDIVRIRNGEVCYWPNLGYGHFGAKVTMDNAPWFDRPDLFDQRRIRLADTDGTGVTDIIYLQHDGARIYFNQSGNRWSDAVAVPQCPPVDNLSSVQVLDLLGSGTACLTWSSPLPGHAGRQLRYVDLMGGQKPHLLVKTVNNLGAETLVHYASSTKFYLADKREGKPWITHLPFPVHVVERVETYDRISRNRFVTRYAYHHGYFDGIEREFRGFGLVEQRDTEEIGTVTPEATPVEDTNWDATSFVPPVLTRTWFHTGVYLGRDHISNFYAGLLDGKDVGEYYREPGLDDAQAREFLLDDTVLPAGLTVEEEREACRALKGSMLRQEVYALDGTDKEKHPYTVTEQNFTIRRLQPKAGNRYAVFFTHAQESISYHYERRLVEVNGQKLADPRVSHAMTLETDEFGNVLRSLAIGYRRRDLPGVDAPEQKQTHLTLTVNRFANRAGEPDWYRVGLPVETRTYEIVKAPEPGIVDSRIEPFGFDQMSILTAALFPLNQTEPDADKTWPYEKWDWQTNAANTPAEARLRLIEHVRTLYRRDDLTGPRPLGEVESLALPFESYKLAFTPGLVAEVYGGRVTDAMLASEGRYVHSEGDANWWIPSGRVFYSPDPAHTPPQELAYARAHFFLPHRYRDPFHTDPVSTETFVRYDAYDLLVQETRDALGNRITVGERNVDPTQPLVRHGQDYRVLQPALVMDPNRNRLAVAFDALGMVVGTAVMGKPEDNPVPGDRLEATFRADLTQAEIDQFFANPKGPQAATLLDNATTRIIYDLTGYWREPDPQQKPPAFAATLARETHASEPVPASGLRIQVSFSYSDGFGREIQKKIQAEPGPAPKRNAEGNIIVGPDGQPEMTPNDVSPRWVGSGWTVFNNKGKPVRQYEPFFTDTHRFEFDVRIGVSPVLFYDPVERVVATLHPNHTWEKVVFDPWRQETWDVNDTITLDPRSDKDVKGFFLKPDDTPRLPTDDYLPTWHALRADPAYAAEANERWPDPEIRDAEKTAAEKAAVHASTQTVAHFDTLGRTFLTVAHNRFERDNAIIEETYPTRVLLDIEGNQREVIDAKDRVVMRYDYDMLSNRIHQASMEAGERWMLNDVAGNPIYGWDSRGHTLRTTYDALRRPTEVFLSENGGPEKQVGRTVYGEAQGEALNHRGRIYQQFDQAGVVTFEAYDFKGNLLRSSRQLAADYKTTLDWSAAPALKAETFTTRTTYDALNRPIQLIAPHSDQPGTKINVLQPVYNEANLLEQMHAWLNQNAEPSGWLNPATANLHAVTDIDYDAKGQRTLIEYGNGVSTTYEYDKDTFRLIRLTTTRPANLNGLASQLFKQPGTVQDLRYAYDPAGNITQIADDALPPIFHNNEQVDPVCHYTYDALYRLIEAKGREHIDQTAFLHNPPNGNYRDYPFAGATQLNNPQAVRTYTERYEYDPVGNFERMIHQAVNGTWTRAYAYNETSQLEAGKMNNRLSSTTLGATTETYHYDDSAGLHGNITAMPHLPLMQWDYGDQLQATAQQVVNNGGTPETTWYVYDDGGQRVRKVTERQAAAGQTPTPKAERIYLGGFEIYREYDGDGNTVELERETLHIMDDKQRIALVETRTQGNDGTPAQLIRYQFSNHLGSASLELDDQAQIISHEEYYPYGSTSYQAVRNQTETPKRYRFTGKERDEETGLYYHGARYYACWLGRWTSADPAGLVDGPGLYNYSRGSPVVLSDPTGTNTPQKPSDRAIMMMTDAQLRAHLVNMSPEARSAFASNASGAFKQRVYANLTKYKLESVRTGVTTVEHVRPQPKPLPSTGGGGGVGDDGSGLQGSRPEKEDEGFWAFLAFIPAAAAEAPAATGIGAATGTVVTGAEAAAGAGAAGVGITAASGLITTITAPTWSPWHNFLAHLYTGRLSDFFNRSNPVTKAETFVNTLPKAAPEPEPKPAPKPAPPDGEKKNRSYVVRLQAQGGGLEESVVLTGLTPITVAEGLAGLETLKGKLARQQLRERAEPFGRAERFIRNAPAGGGVGPPGRSFALPRSDIRVDVEILRGINFRE